MTFTSLPSETIIHILALTNPATIRRFRELSSAVKVSHSFRVLVMGSPLLQHIIVLDLCGYVEPLVPPKELSLTDRVDMLYAHHARRANTDQIPPFLIQVRVPSIQGLGINLKSYHEGVYAQYSRSAKVLSLYQFYSPDHGANSKAWQHSSPATVLVGLSVHATLDLLVWLEAFHPRPFEAQASLNQEYGYKIHLCSLTTGLQHADAGADSILHGFTAPHTVAKHTIHILGNLLAVSFISVREPTPGRVIVWDWTTCLELVRIDTPGSKYTSFAFLSERLFVITQNSSFFEGNNQTNTGSFGRLNIYSLDSIRSENTMNFAYPIVQLSLPPISRGLSGSFIQIRETNSSAASSYICPSSRPRLYDLPPKRRTICLDIVAWPVRHTAGGPGPYGTLLIPVDVLLEAAHPFCGLVLDSPMPHVSTCLLWSEWAHRTFWCNTSAVGIPHSAAGTMYAEPSSDRNTGGIIIWNFRNPIPIPDTPQHLTGSSFLTSAVPPQMGIRSMIQLDSRYLPLTSVLLDNEYSKHPLNFIYLSGS
ncbi:hypothetical protein FRC12_023684 [Ceratobasidium sp. 428]|nr:hypothetical protein FRC12_023684 [Ceratobasidium sp. 428]